MVIFSKNPVHSVLFLILVFLLNICFFFLLGADFIAFIFMIVYVGAIAVLFLFVVMMLNIRSIEVTNVFINYLPLSALIVFVFFFEFNYAFTNLPYLNLSLVYDTLFEFNNTDYVDFLEFTYSSSIVLFGYLLYTHFAFEFILAGLILLLAMIGSISLTLNQIVVLRREDIFEQIDRSIDQSIKIIKINNNNK